jgi:exoribonuclease R
MVHRLLYLYLEEKTLPKIEKLESRCIYLSEREKKLKMKRINKIYAMCLSDFIGKIFKGIVTSVMEYGFLLRYLKMDVKG